MVKGSLRGSVPNVDAGYPARYAPTDMKPAWPRENCPETPLINWSDTARIMLMPMSITMRRMYSPRCAGFSRYLPSGTRSAISTGSAMLDFSDDQYGRTCGSCSDFFDDILAK